MRCFARYASKTKRAGTWPLAVSHQNPSPCGCRGELPKRYCLMQGTGAFSCPSRPWSLRLSPRAQQTQAQCSQCLKPLLTSKGRSYGPAAIQQPTQNEAIGVQTGPSGRRGEGAAGGCSQALET